jgi:FAD/FMN-containing dehydrogenase
VNEEDEMTYVATEEIELAVLTEHCAGKVVTPNDERWDEARQAWNLTVDQQPAAVVFPESAEDVAAAVRHARRYGLQVAPQGTGHNAGPLGSLEDTLLVRMSGMRDVEIDPIARRARAAAGALWQDVVEPAAAFGLTALHGSSPDVGVVGYSLGGGVGWQARLRGLAANSVTAIELLTAEGEHVRADHDHDPELFWALRGGGGNFGVVTSLEFELYPLRSVYAGWLIWPWEQTEAVFTRWSEWVRTVPDELTSVARILRLPPLELVPEPLRGRDVVVVEAAYLGTEGSGATRLAPLRELEPEIDTFAMMPAAALSRLHQDPEGPTPGIGEHAMLDELPAAAVEAIAAMAGPGSESPLLSVEVRHLGGALGVPAYDGGALSHLDGQFLTFAVGLPMDPAHGAAIARHAHVVTQGLAPFGRGRGYLNFAEEQADARTFYPSETYRRLQAIRAQVDPDNLFQANHPIPVAE